jgi:hypothetical protein
LQRGWNGSGPIRESDALRAIVRDLEVKVTFRLREETESR